MKRTPLFEKHAALGARMAPFGGWDMPIQYEGILAEHAHTRREASIFDICHMGELDISGPSAEADLERLLTQAVRTLQVGQCRYGYLLRDDGGVLDDLTCYRRGPERYMLVVNAATCDQDRDWVRAHLSPGTRFEDISPRTAKLDIQGPTARTAMEKALGHALPDLKYFWFIELKLLGAPCILSRTGYTGEWGYEVYFPWDEAVRFWDAFTANPAIKPAGLGARDTLRLEMAYPLYGHELGLERTPVPASRGAFVDKGKEFIGKAAVARDAEKGAPRYLVGLRLESKQAARSHDPVLNEGRAIGEVTSGSIAPSLGVAVALAYVNAGLDRPGQGLEIEARGRRLPGTVVELPFYKDGTARRK